MKKHTLKKFNFFLVFFYFLLCAINATFEQKDNDNLVDAEKDKTNTVYSFFTSQLKKSLSAALLCRSKEIRNYEFLKKIKFWAQKLIQIKFLVFLFLLFS